jgi:hypothetical protein
MDQPSGEMSVINAALADARSGQGAVVLIDGRAGLGTGSRVATDVALYGGRTPAVAFPSSHSRQRGCRILRNGLRQIFGSSFGRDGR